MRNATYPKHKPETIQDKIDELKRENLEVELLNEEAEKLAKDVSLLRKKELAFREEQCAKYTRECHKELGATKVTLKKIGEKAGRAQGVLDELKI